ncbi:putative reverse transcriptase zinc-binding domain-containing protein [Helianthus debilis subsp. tardiflorus]
MVFFFFGEWDENNLRTLRRILRCFHLMSGLKVNQNKSFIYGVGKDESEVQHMASVLNCKPGTFPFTYLGLKVGANMNRIASWKEVIDKLHKRLSNWKAKILSFAGRLTLIKSVLGSITNYFLSLYKAPKAVIRKLEGIRQRFLWGGCGGVNKIRWVKWEKVVGAKNMGGLGVGGIRELNLALLLKWWWRLKENPNQLWVKVVESIHSNTKKVSQIPLKKGNTGIWKNIAGIGEDFKKNGIDIQRGLNSVVGNGEKTLFWQDTWTTHGPLKYAFPLCYNLAKNKRDMVAKYYKMVQGVRLWDWIWIRAPNSLEEQEEMQSLNTLLVQQKMGEGNDVWRWKEEKDTGFSVRSVRRDLGGQLDLNIDANNFYWNRIATSKANLFAWRASEGKIPTFEALRKRGINVTSQVCKVCGMRTETTDHILIQCQYADLVWTQVDQWLNVPDDNIMDEVEARLLCVNGLGRSKAQQKIIHAVFLATLWYLWKNRNNIVFHERTTSTNKLVEEIKEETFEWMRQRSKNVRVSWSDWRRFNIQM